MTRPIAGLLMKSFFITCLVLQLCARGSDAIMSPHTDSIDVKPFSPSSSPKLLLFALCCIRCLLVILVRRVVVEKTDSKYSRSGSLPYAASCRYHTRPLAGRRVRVLFVCFPIASSRCFIL
ncbi:hypothetical protein EDB85DRAFT_512529 [Lactarius pseudohatsudake]|nr:hypothetical protein EDB85DRAFT_512529 [Lactarius pseudohatsudake]